MHTVDLLDAALAAAAQLGYGVRQEWLGGNGGGGCEIKGRKWIFLDLALSTAEQLDQVLDVLRRDPDIVKLPLTTDLARRLGVRRVA